MQIIYKVIMLVIEIHNFQNEILLRVYLNQKEIKMISNIKNLIH